jgi:hypothetical protein
MLEYWVPPNRRVWAFFFIHWAPMSIGIQLMQTFLANHLGHSWALTSTLPVHAPFPFWPWCLPACILSLLLTWHSGPFRLANWSCPCVFCNWTCSTVKNCWKTEQVASMPFDLSLQHHAVSFLRVHQVEHHFLFCEKFCIKFRLKGFVESLHHHACLKLHLPH